MSVKPNRRDFLQSGVMLAAASNITISTPREDRLSKAPETNMQPIVDTHQHLWDLKKFRLPWIKPGSPLGRSFLPEDYRQATAGLNVVKAIYMEVDLDPAQQPAEAEYVQELCRTGSALTVAGVISGRPASPGFAAYVARYRDSPVIKGVRQVLHNAEVPAGYCLDKAFIKGIRLLGELGMSYDICIRPGELADAVKLIDSCPDTRFILDHCGNGDAQAHDISQWKRDMEAIAQRSHVVGKISGVVVTAKPDTWTPNELAPIVNHTLTVFGPDRVMFGGDWPVCTLKSSYRRWVEALRTILQDRSAAEQRKLFHDNAIRFYRL